MARKKDKRRVKKEQLALAVRKNFNAQAVTETNCIVDWIYTVKNQGASRSLPAWRHDELTKL
jgi:histone deacetylase complex subunit SAP30